MEKEDKMFYYQCSQAARGEGCEVVGICGKNPTIARLQDNLIYSIQGMSGYLYRARRVGFAPPLPEIDDFVSRAFYTMFTNVNFDPESYLDLAIESGRMNLKGMKLLKVAYNERYGEPQPTRVQTGIKKGKGIIITGHGLKVLEELLKAEKSAISFLWEDATRRPVKWNITASLSDSFPAEILGLKNNEQTLNSSLIPAH